MVLFFLVFTLLFTSAANSLTLKAKLEAAGLRVEDVVVLIDRRPADARGDLLVTDGTASDGGGGSPRSRDAMPRAYRLHAVFTLEQLLDHYERTGAVSAAQAAEVRAFLGE